MAGAKEQFDHERLIQAADAVLWAAVKVWMEQRGRPSPYPLDLRGGTERPECLRRFTRREIAEASEFLVRLGVIKKPSRAPRLE